MNNARPRVRANAPNRDDEGGEHLEAILAILGRKRRAACQDLDREKRKRRPSRDLVQYQEGRIDALRQAIGIICDQKRRSGAYQDEE